MRKVKITLCIWETTSDSAIQTDRGSRVRYATLRNCTWFWLRSQSQGCGIDLHVRPCAECGACLRFSLSPQPALLPCLCALSLSQKYFKIKKCHGLDDLSKHFFLIVLETGESKVRMPTDLVSSESQLPCPRSGSKLFPGSSYKDTNSNMISSSSWPSYLPRPHLQTSSHWGLGFQHMNLEGTQTFGPQQEHDLMHFASFYFILFKIFFFLF